MELDPVFVRALRLLHSTSKESGMQLKAMLDESIRMKKNPGSAPSKIAVSAPQQTRESHTKDTTDRYNNIRALVGKSVEVKGKARIVNNDISSLFCFQNRRNLDKLKRDLSELVPETKKPRLHSPARSSPGITPR